MVVGGGAGGRLVQDAQGGRSEEEWVRGGMLMGCACTPVPLACAGCLSGPLER